MTITLSNVNSPQTAGVPRFRLGILSLADELRFRHRVDMDWSGFFFVILGKAAKIYAPRTSKSAADWT